MDQKKVYIMGPGERILDPEVYRAMFDHYVQCMEPALPHISQLSTYCAPENIPTFIAPDFPGFKEPSESFGHMKGPYRNRNKRGTK